MSVAQSIVVDVGLKRLICPLYLVNRLTAQRRPKPLPLFQHLLGCFVPDVGAKVSVDELSIPFSFGACNGEPSDLLLTSFNLPLQKDREPLHRIEKVMQAARPL